MEKKYCASPWRGLHLNFEGNIKTCCAAHPTVLGSYDNNNKLAQDNRSIDQILQSDAMKEVRASIKQGILHPKYCLNCINNENAGFGSERSWHNNISPDFDCATAELDDHKPALMDIRWNNTCNLACTYCSPYFSTKWASIKGEPFNRTINSDYSKIIDYIEKHQDTVKEVALVGGEPLMMKENDKLLDILPDEVLLTVITNMTTDFDRMPVPQKLLKRSRVGWSMSFDNVYDRFEYVRWGSSWERFDKNLKTVVERTKNSGQHCGIQAVYTIYNCTRLCELKQYAMQNNNLNICWQHVWGDEIDPQQHNEKVRKLAIEELIRYRDNFSLRPMEIDFVTQQLDKLQNSSGDRKEDFNKFTDDVENRWHPDQKGKFKKLWPELAEALW
jgi:organic radical activating enzyme